VALRWEGADRRLIPFRGCREAAPQFCGVVTTEVRMDMQRSSRRRRSIFQRFKRLLLLRPWALQVALAIIRLIVEKTLK
jgi:hypothetical protein